MLLKVFAKKNKKSFILDLFSIVFLGLSFWMIQAPKAEAACLVDNDCDDSNICTDDTCNAGNCSNIANAVRCDDGKACTINDVCSSIIPKVCDGAVSCDNNCIGLTARRGGSCDVAGNCVYATIEDCDDKEFCTDDFCDSSTGTCSRIFDAHTGQDCSTNNYCVFNEKCTNDGICSGTARSCNDNNLCTDDSCDSVSAVCINSNNTASCDDGNLCTNKSGSSMNHSGCNALTDRCAGGVCVGIPVSCENSCENPTTCTGGFPCIRNYNGSCDPGDGCCKNYSTDDCAVIGNVGYCRDNVCDPVICRHPFTPATCALIANPAALNIGDGSILSWSTTCGKANTVSIDNGLGSNLPLSGSKSIFPLVNTTYLMSVDNYHDQQEVHPNPEGTYPPGAQGTCSALVPFVIPTCTLTADRNSVVSGSATTLHWTTTNALTGTISGGGLSNVDAAPILKGSINTPEISAATVFEMFPVGPGGTGHCSITISPLNPPPGGLVPCGRLADNPATSWNETALCTSCHLVVLAYNIINFLLSIVGIVALLMLIIGGLLHIIGGVDADFLTVVQEGIKKILLGFAIVFVTWVIINIAMIIFGFIDPIGDGSWEKFNCNSGTGLHAACGNGNIEGTEVCEIGDTQACTGIFTTGLPAHCSGVSVSGTQNCNSSCTGWNDCVLGTPTIIGDTSPDDINSCDYLDIVLTDYTCCGLTDCLQDYCDCCGRDAGAAIPIGYNNVQSLSPCGLANNSCRLNQSTDDARNWYVTTNHTITEYECWR